MEPLAVIARQTCSMSSEQRFWRLASCATNCWLQETGGRDEAFFSIQTEIVQLSGY